MRVIAGEFRSRKLLSLPGVDVRPTPDRLRETLFNILSPVIEHCVFVDAYAGTGSVGIEALSRGARHATFIEKNRQAVELIHQNLASLHLAARARVIMGAGPIHLSGIAADVVFLDPPYPKEREYEASLDSLATKPPQLVIAQHSVRFALEEAYGALRRTRILKQGDNALSFFSPEG
ncbi:MAG: rRNA (guanine966-N2)-methyltransferase [Bryobacterales bacterium]|nr:rRNA (guanine966-N2)-methyltransferase [Bryobacterales bacterium]